MNKKHYNYLEPESVISADPTRRLEVIEKFLFNETATQAIARLKDPTNGNEKFDKESAAMQGTTISRHGTHSDLFVCTRCLLHLNLDGKGKFRPSCNYSETFLVKLALTPLEDRCDHKKKNLTVDKMYLDYCGEVQPAGI